MNYLFTFVFSFIIVYLVYFVVIICRKKGLDSFKRGKQFDFFVKVYKLDVKKLNVKKFANSLFLINSFIIAFTLTILEFFDNFVLKLLLCVIVLIPLMVIMYNILGNYYKKKEGD